MVFRLIYASKAAKGVGESDFRAIAMFSAISNRAHGITGLLLTYNDEIMQILEGDEAHVRGLYTNIQADSRHHSVTLVREQNIKSPDFSDWSMGYRPLAAPIDMDIFFKLTRDSLANVLALTDDLQAPTADFADRAGLD
ncbi:BLUF domain-containing protein [Robiginitomaculum antarcticum]|uniref:BLUF domain-containing protein n=1 Tax=Robiginitomaculum antarcticum TaxID=437507 RepID=UPI000381C6D7|nr:BLUF domain-containing protein [Robiginitomaculum antarcticum]